MDVNIYSVEKSMDNASLEVENNNEGGGRSNYKKDLISLFLLKKFLLSLLLI